MRNVYTVKQVNAYVKNMFAQDFMLNRIYVKGEVSNLKYHTSGHIYFSLKDESGTIACVMFAGQRSGLSFRMHEGQQVIVLGSVTIYERDGKYQLYAREIVLDGAGLLYERFQQLKSELEEMGMFASEYKQPIPKYVKRVGIVTAPTGAAVRDIINIATRRNPYVQLILYPAKVQGDGAAESIVRGIKVLEAQNIDVMIVGRGGGSMEDLWAFNEEIVARAIYECNTPIISAVGHEIDFTIADFVADLRAPTPTGAAEMCVPTIMDTNILINNLVIRATKTIKNMVNQKFVMLERFKRSYILKNPYSMYEIKEQKLDILIDNLKNNMENIITKKTHLYENITSSYILTNPMILIDNKSNKLDILIKSLSLLNPMSILDKGYSIVKHDDKVIKQIKDVKKGDNIDITLAKGIISAKVMEVKNGK